MNECKAIRDALLNRREDLMSLLLRTRRLAQDTGNNRVRDWAEHELNGYPQHQALPEYREIPAQSFVKLQGNQLVIESIRFPTEFIPDELQEELGVSRLFNPVADYLPYLQGKYKDELCEVWYRDQLAQINEAQRFMPGMVCLAGWKAIQRSAICEMVASCRDELLFGLSEIEFGLGQRAPASVSSAYTSKHNMLMVAISGGVTQQAQRQSA
ncbi:hypothetical protein [Silvimonas soli]|uniref:AbiTii domain-containing protein n=1 Tax=Silvimonas soli TaxID=2980100 RepID=UPI0024B3A5E3|nr:hypothetical protein [Silvimonas soli]